MSAAVVTSPTTKSITEYFLNNGVFADGNSSTSHKSSHISNSNMSSTLSHEAALPTSDPALNGDMESMIPIRHVFFKPTETQVRKNLYWKEY